MPWLDIALVVFLSFPVVFRWVLELSLVIEPYAPFRMAILVVFGFRVYWWCICDGLLCDSSSFWLRRPFLVFFSWSIWSGLLYGAVACFVCPWHWTNSPIQLGLIFLCFLWTIWWLCTLFGFGTWFTFYMCFYGDESFLLLPNTTWVSFFFFFLCGAELDSHFLFFSPQYNLVVFLLALVIGSIPGSFCFFLLFSLASNTHHCLTRQSSKLRLENGWDFPNVCSLLVLSLFVVVLFGATYLHCGVSYWDLFLWCIILHFLGWWPALFCFSFY